jgi:hypothetical protein
MNEPSLQSETNSRPATLFAQSNPNAKLRFHSGILSRTMSAFGPKQT